MALLFGDCAATVYERIETADPTTKVVTVSEGAGVPIACQIEPMRNIVAIDAVAGVELGNPYRLRVEPEDIETPSYGARVVWNDTGLQFRVTRRASLQDAQGELSSLAYGVAEMELLEVEQ